MSGTVLALAAALGLGARYAWVGGEIAAGFAAKMTCSCAFVSDREGAACEQELAAQGMGWVRVRLDRQRRVVDATALGIRRATARYQGTTGCVLE